MYKLLFNEVYKLFARRRIYTLLGILFIISLLVLASALVTRNVYAIGKIYGQTFPLTLFDGVAGFVLPVFVVLLVTSLVTDEYADGSLKLPLLRQVSRTELLQAKIGAVVLALSIFLIFILFLGYLYGAAIYGLDGSFVIKGREMSSLQGVLFTLFVYGSSILPLLSFAMIILFFSVTLSNAGSVVGTGIGFLIVSVMIGQVFPAVKPFLISSYFNTFGLFASDLGWIRMALALVMIVLYGGLFYILSTWVFNRKDFML